MSVAPVVEHRLGPFDLLRPVAKGATATVWRGNHRGLGLPVAVKVLTHTRWKGQRRGGFFERELRTVARLDHPAVVRVHDYGWLDREAAAASGGQLEPGCPYLVMDWLAGGSLAAAPDGLPFEQLRALLLRILDGLAYIHARGFIHRDIKPANVLMGSAGPVLTDLGTAYSVTGVVEMVAERGILGTPNYMAPEQVSGKPWLFGPWTDLYALGCMTWKMATGQPPYVRRTVTEILRARLRDPLPSFTALTPLPAAFEGWVRRLLAREPANRFRFAADAAQALMQIGPPMGAPIPTIAWWAAEAEDEPTHLDGDVSGSDVSGGDVSGGDVSGGDVSGGDASLALPPTVLLDETVVPTLAVLQRAYTMPAFTLSEAPLAEDGGSMAPAPLIDWREAERPPHTVLPDCGRRLAQLRVPTMTGRDDARDTLWQQLNETITGGRARLVMVDGPTGAGKTRLVDWLAHRAHELGRAETVWIRAREATTRGSGLWSMLPRRVATQARTVEALAPQLAAALGLAPEYAAAIAAYAPQVRSKGQVIGEREATLATQAALAVLSSQRPVVVIIDDAQLDDTALNFVQRVLARRPELPLLFVLAVDRRAANLDPRASGRLDALARMAAVAPLALTPLDTPRVAEIVDRRLPLEPDTRRILCEVAGGNPLHAEVIAQHWLDLDVLTGSSVGYRPRSGQPLPLPRSLVDAWRLRLNHILRDRPAEAGEVLELAAVLGSPLELPVWSAVCAQAGLPGPERLLATLLDADILGLSDAVELSLSHPLLSEALTERARRGGRLRRWHGLCAEVLASALDGPDHRSLERVARHLSAAGRHDEAVSRWIEVCRSANSLGGQERYRSAVLGAARAFRATRRPRTDEQWASIKLAWVARFIQLESVERALRHARQGERFARAGGHLAPAADLIRAQAHRLNTIGRSPEAEALLGEALQLITGLGDPGIRGRVLETQCRIALQRGRLSEGWDLAVAAGEAAKAAGDRQTLAATFNRRGEIARRRGELGVAAQAYLRVIETTPRPAFAALARCNLSLVQLESGALDDAEASAEALLWELERLGLPFHMVAANLVLLACAGQRRDARAWDRAWATLDGVRALKMVEYDVGRCLEMAARAASSSMPRRARAAGRLAAAVYDKIGRGDKAAEVRRWITGALGVEGEVGAPR